MHPTYGVWAVLSLLGAAGQTAALLPASANQTLKVDETPCEACTNLVTILKAYIANPTTQQQAMNYVLENVCPKLPAEDRQYCAIYTPIAIAAAAGWVASRDAAALCSQIQLCPAKVRSSLFR